MFEGRLEGRAGLCQDIVGRVRAVTERQFRRWQGRDAGSPLSEVI